MSYVQQCTCGHDISSHFRDSTTRKLHGCLAMQCDCPVYWDRNKPAPVVPTKVEVDDRSAVSNDSGTWAFLASVGFR